MLSRGGETLLRNEFCPLSLSEEFRTPRTLTYIERSRLPPLYQPLPLETGAALLAEVSTTLASDRMLDAKHE